MKFYIDSLLVLFPYDFIYPEQLEYMRSLKEGLDKRGHLVLEMPSGTGKTISLMSLLVAYWAAHSSKAKGRENKRKNQNNNNNNNNNYNSTQQQQVKQEEDALQQGDDVVEEEDDERLRVFYCTRTVAEMVKASGELKRLVEYWKTHEPGAGVDNFTGVCLSARKNLCANADVAKFTYGQEVDAACRHVTSEWSTTKCPLYSSIDIEDLAAMSDDNKNKKKTAFNNNNNKAKKSNNNITTTRATAAVTTNNNQNKPQETENNYNSNNRSSLLDDEATVPPIINNATATAGTTKTEEQNPQPPAAGGGETLFVPPGVHDVDGLLQLGLGRGVCPYLMSRHAVAFEADIIIASFLYMVDPKVSPAVTRHLPRQTIVVLDEGHNVDDVCIEALSMVVTRKDTGVARDTNMKDLENHVNRMKQQNRQRLQEEFVRIATGRDLVPAAGGVPQQQNVGGGGGGGAAQAHSALIPQEILDKAVPAPLRQLNHFLPLLTRIVEFFHRFICRMTFAQVADPLTFLSKVRDECQADIQHLRFLSGRLASLLQVLQIDDLHKYRHVVLIADFVTTLATHLHNNNMNSGNNSSNGNNNNNNNIVTGGGGGEQHTSAAAGTTTTAATTAASGGEAHQFAVVCEPHDPQNPHMPDPIIQLACLDASLAMKNVFEQFDSVVLTSGTLSPLHLPPKILGFEPCVARSLPMTLSRRCVAPLIVTRSADQASLEDVTLTSSFKVRKDAAVNRHVLQAYASLVKQLAQVVPDGIVVFFTGYQYMNEVLSEWNANGFLKELAELKLIFIETQGVEETAKCLTNFRRACDIGRGAIFFSIARGKIAEGIDFDRHYGRAVVMFGVPYLPPTDRALNERLKWMQTTIGVTDTEYRTFDAMRQASQVLGRVIRNKTDYGLMVLVDRRFSRPELRKKLPEWIAACIDANAGNLSTESAVMVARRFFREMAQPWDRETELGNTLLDVDTMAARGFATPQLVPRSVRSKIDTANNNGGEEGENNSNNNAAVGNAAGGGDDEVVEVVGSDFRAARAPGEVRQGKRRARN